ncbi:MAG: amino acid permease [Clostridia bacterium]|nr:amino acid permease [Clostridia bacterium]
MPKRNKMRLQPFVTPTGAWALSLGTSVGWGSLVVTTNSYLMQAGPLGSCLGLLIGGFLMWVIARNYHYMMNRFPETGGSYTFVRHALGYDPGFVVAWFVLITYLAILWANATSLPLFARYFMGGVFEFGHMYSLFGYQVYFGEALLSIGAIVLIAFLSARHRHTTSLLMTGLVCTFTLGITICFVASLFHRHTSLEPQMIPDKDGLAQILKIAVISPWAFIGFENISHAAEEFRFEQKKSFEVLTVSLIFTTLIYFFVMFLSISTYPPEYDSWLSYIRDLSNLSGIKALPPFYAAYSHMGKTGVWILMISLLALVITSLIGNIYALSRLLYALAQDNLVWNKFAEVNDKGLPGNAIWFVVAVSAVVPFLGRTAIGWIVDVTTLGATMIYAFVSIATAKMAMTRDDALEKKTGIFGAVSMFAFMIYVLGLNVFTTENPIDKAALFLFAVWAMLGILYFRYLLSKGKNHNLGQSPTVWIALITHLLLISLVWISQMTMDEIRASMNNIQEHYVNIGYGEDQTWFIQQELEGIHWISALSVVVVVIIFGSAVCVLLTAYGLMRKRADASEQQLSTIQKIANTDPLTGLNSKHAYAEMEHMLDEAMQDSTKVLRFGIVVCDVNGLKFVNDTLGHKAGDAYIKSASEMIHAIFRRSLIYRTGGDEFVVLLKGRDYKNREALLQQLHDVSVAHIAEGTVVVSGGLSDFQPEQDKSVHDVFVRADALMYQEKMALKGLGAKTRE